MYVTELYFLFSNFSSTYPPDSDDNDAPCKARLSLSGKCVLLWKPNNVDTHLFIYCADP